MILHFIFETIVLAGAYFIYFNFVAVMAEELGIIFVHWLNNQIKKEKQLEEETIRKDEEEYLKWLHLDKDWLGE